MDATTVSYRKNCYAPCQSLVTLRKVTFNSSRFQSIQTFWMDVCWLDRLLWLLRKWNPKLDHSTFHFDFSLDIFMHLNTRRVGGGGGGGAIWNQKLNYSMFGWCQLLATEFIRELFFLNENDSTDWSETMITGIWSLFGRFFRGWLTSRRHGELMPQRCLRWIFMIQSHLLITQQKNWLCWRLGFSRILHIVGTCVGGLLTSRRHYQPIAQHYLCWIFTIKLDLVK